MIPFWLHLAIFESSHYAGHFSDSSRLSTTLL